MQMSTSAFQADPTLKKALTRGSLDHIVVAQAPAKARTPLVSADTQIAGHYADSLW